MFVFSAICKIFAMTSFDFKKWCSDDGLEGEHDRGIKEQRSGQPGRLKVSSCGRFRNAGLNPRREETIHAGLKLAERQGPRPQD